MCALRFPLTALFLGMLVISSPAGEEPTDLPTRRSDQAVVTGRFEGAVAEKVPGDTGGEGQLTFLFSQVPEQGLTFFDFYDSARQEVVIDFYDSFLGESSLGQVQVAPFTSLVTEQLIIDLNAGIEGLAPDLREVVRMRLRCAYDLPVSISQDEQGLVDLVWRWSEEIRLSFGPRRNKSYWSIPLAMAIAAGIGIGTLSMR